MRTLPVWFVAVLLGLMSPLLGVTSVSQVTFAQEDGLAVTEEAPTPSPAARPIRQPTSNNPEPPPNPAPEPDPTAAPPERPERSRDDGGSSAAPNPKPTDTPERSGRSRQSPAHVYSEEGLDPDFVANDVESSAKLRVIVTPLALEWIYWEGFVTAEVDTHVAFVVEDPDPNSGTSAAVLRYDGSADCSGASVATSLPVLNSDPLFSVNVVTSSVPASMSFRLRDADDNPFGPCVAVTWVNPEVSLSFPNAPATVGVQDQVDLNVLVTANFDVTSLGQWLMYWSQCYAGTAATCSNSGPESAVLLPLAQGVPPHASFSFTPELPGTYCIQARYVGINNGSGSTTQTICTLATGMYDIVYTLNGPSNSGPFVAADPLIVPVNTSLAFYVDAEGDFALFNTAYSDSVCTNQIGSGYSVGRNASSRFVPGTAFTTASATFWLRLYADEARTIPASGCQQVSWVDPAVALALQGLPTIARPGDVIDFGIEINANWNNPAADPWLVEVSLCAPGQSGGECASTSAIPHAFPAATVPNPFAGAYDTIGEWCITATYVGQYADADDTVTECVLVSSPSPPPSVAPTPLPSPSPTPTPSPSPSSILLTLSAVACTDAPANGDVSDDCSPLPNIRLNVQADGEPVEPAPLSADVLTYPWVTGADGRMTVPIPAATGEVAIRVNPASLPPGAVPLADPLILTTFDDETVVAVVILLPRVSPSPEVSPSVAPSPRPTRQPIPSPTVAPTAEPTPTAAPTVEPTPSPTAAASVRPSPLVLPSPTPMASPTAQPTAQPTGAPSPAVSPIPIVVEALPDTGMGSGTRSMWWLAWLVTSIGIWVVGRAGRSVIAFGDARP